MRFVAGIWRLLTAALGIWALETVWGVPYVWTYVNVQCTALIAFVMLWSAAASLIHGQQPPAWLKGGVTVYALLLVVGSFTVIPSAPLDVASVPVMRLLGLGVPALMHWVVPGMAFLDFLLFDPHHRLKALDVLIWLIYPVAYVGFLLVRGTWMPHAGPGMGGSSYPMAFLDPTLLGWSQFGVSCLKVAAAVLVLGALLCLLDRAMPDRPVLGAA